MKPLLIFLVRVYQFVHAPFFRGTCRFHPTCSEYAVEALEAHGAAKGTGLALFRLLRCQPLCRGGFDPVPGPAKPRSTAEGRFA